jgi:type I restriction enzyme S subunit
MQAKINDFNSLIGVAAREGQSLDKGQLMQKLIYISTKDILHDFYKVYIPITKMKNNLGNENNNLVSLRDTLLPRLMSGELKINDISV